MLRDSMLAAGCIRAYERQTVWDRPTSTRSVELAILRQSEPGFGDVFPFEEVPRR